ncbi:cytochrome P450 86B1-like [Rutidosis leptorrhynchoides]|uniref:cytochrome P450 86B1-like n=1 Tax=Rutidosis leptorrhynchoides TaxID=125765 RepID=UPI003A9A5F2E
MQLDYNMILNFLFSLTRWLYFHLLFTDITISLLIIFIFNSILNRITRTGLMIWPVFGILPTFALHASNLYEWGSENLIKYGGTFYYRGMWMGGTFGVVTSDPLNIEYMLKTNFKNFPKGQAYKERFYDFLGDGIFNADDELWRTQRRVANSEMHSTRFIQFSLESVRNLVHNKLLKVLEAKKGCVIDLQDVLLRFTFDNTCSVAFGVDSGCLEVDFPETPFAKAFEKVTFATLMRFLVPRYIWKPMKFFRLGFENTMYESVKIVHDFSEKTVRERKMELLSNKEGIIGNSRCDLLSRLIIMEQDKKEVFFTDKLLQDFCISFILAGRDTSSVGLSWFFWLITQNPQVETRILDEIHTILQQRDKPYKDNQENIVFTEEELKKMVYLQAAISESLRLYPPVSFDHKQPREDDVFPDGTHIGKGARVVYCMYGMARMETLWGKDCLEFRPERWIKDGEFVSESQFKYAVFNAGPRLCVGKKFAYMQMKLVVSSILLRYKVKLVEGHKVCPKLNTTLYMKYGLLVTMEPRV